MVDFGLRRSAAVTHNPLKTLLRRFVRRFVRRSAAVPENSTISMCGGCAADVLHPPPYPLRVAHIIVMMRTRYESTSGRGNPTPGRHDELGSSKDSHHPSKLYFRSPEAALSPEQTPNARQLSPPHHGGNRV